MFKYNVPFETIIGLKSVNPIVRYIKENIPKNGKLVVYYEPMHNKLPANLKKVLQSLKWKNHNIKIEQYACLAGNVTEINATYDASIIIVCGTSQLSHAFNRIELRNNLPIIFLESETASMNALNCIYFENGDFKHCKFNRTIVADNSVSKFNHDDFKATDTAWMYTISLINLIKNDKLNPLLRANYGACVDFLSWFLSDNKDKRIAKNSLTILKKGIACFYNAFNNDYDNKINKQFFENITSWSEFAINCINILSTSYPNLKMEKEFLYKLDKYNIHSEHVENAVNFYVNNFNKGAK